jgi:4-hydroxy-2-oxoheptanedioate aldolase
MATDMSSEAITTRWRAGQTTLGGWLSLAEPLVAEAAALAGFDYVVVDMQHGRADVGTVPELLRAVAGHGVAPVVRVPWNEPGIIGRVLDLGALGVIVPMVNSAHEAREAVAACRYAPHGRRSVGPLVVNQRYGAGYFAAANGTVACICMIETEHAVAHIDEILSVGGIDAVYVGPADLSVTMGLAPTSDQTDPRFDAALASVVEACARHGVVAGIHASAALAAKRARQGFQMITVSMDFVSVVAGQRADLATARAGVGAGGEPALGSAGGAAGPYSA